jgi:EAL domain-containing protein (putative c-di-GMP-specific phosphodiesterase class I)
MYQAKEVGSAAFRFYSPDMNAKIFEKLLIESALYGALNRNEFLVYYQPRIDSLSKKIVGVEALVRWDNPDKGLISPADFIPMAEEIGLVGTIGEWVLYQACEQNKIWQNMGLPPIKVSVNLAPQQLNNPNFVNTIKSILENTQLEAKYLELEITESSLMKNIEHVMTTLIAIRELGVAISIDDFGTGYSSLAYLKRLPIDTLKIDRSFINDLGQDKDDDAIVTATIAMAHSMNMQVVAEGVTSDLQVQFLLGKSCDEMQGFLFSQPYPADMITKSMEKTCWF